MSLIFKIVENNYIYSALCAYFAKSKSALVHSICANIVDSIDTYMIYVI